MSILPTQLPTKQHIVAAVGGPSKAVNALMPSVHHPAQMVEVVCLLENVTVLLDGQDMAVQPPVKKENMVQTVLILVLVKMELPVIEGMGHAIV